jgi:hypothetical protein
LLCDAVRIAGREPYESEELTSPTLFEALVKLVIVPIQPLFGSPAFNKCISAKSCSLRALTNVIHVSKCADKFVDCGGLRQLLKYISGTQVKDAEEQVPPQVLYFIVRLIYMLSSSR